MWASMGHDFHMKVQDSLTFARNALYKVEFPPLSGEVSHDLQSYGLDTTAEKDHGVTWLLTHFFWHPWLWSVLIIEIQQNRFLEMNMNCFVLKHHLSNSSHLTVSGRLLLSTTTKTDFLKRTFYVFFPSKKQMDGKKNGMEMHNFCFGL